MINASDAFREKLEAGEPVRMVVDITFPDGTKKTIDEEIMNGDNGRLLADITVLLINSGLTSWRIKDNLLCSAIKNDRTLGRFPET